MINHYVYSGVVHFQSLANDYATICKRYNVITLAVRLLIRCSYEKVRQHLGMYVFHILYETALLKLLFLLLIILLLC